MLEQESKTTTEGLLSEGAEEDGVQDVEMVSLNETVEYRGDYTLRQRVKMVNVVDPDGKTSKRIGVLQGTNHQHVLEQTDSKFVSISRLSSSPSFWMWLLRIIYTVGAVLFAGFVIVFSVAIIVHLFLGIVADFQVAEDSSAWFGISSLFSIPVFMYALSSAITISFGLVEDVWEGFPFFKVVFNWSDLVVQWIAFTTLFIIPSFVMAVSMIIQIEFWYLTAMTIFFVLLILFVVYAVGTTVQEANASVQTLKTILTDPKRVDTFWKLMLEVVRTSLTYQLSLYMDETRDVTLKEEVVGTSTPCFSWCCGCMPCKSAFFQFLQIPKRMDTPYYRQHEGLRTEWDLFYFWHSRVTTTTSLTKSERYNSLSCVIIGLVLAFFIPLAFAAYFDASAGLYVFVAIIVGIILFATVGCSMLFFMRKYWNCSKSTEPKNPSFHFKEEAHTTTNETLLHNIRETRVRTAQPKELFMWVMFGLIVVLFFIIPIVGLFVIENYALGIMFVVLAIVTFVRYVFSIRHIFEEFGTQTSLEALHQSLAQEDDEELKFRTECRIHMIIMRMSKQNVRNGFLVILLVVILISSLIFFMTLATNTYDSSSKTQTFLYNFTTPEDLTSGLQYPICKPKIGEMEDGNEFHLRDLAYLAHVAYLEDRFTQDQLNGWFGMSPLNASRPVAVFQPDVVKSFRESNDFVSSKASYKLIEFPDQNTDLITIRGTAVPLDMFMDLQLWGAAFLFQIVRTVLPVGVIWTPILPDLVYYVSILEGRNLNRVAYYKEISSFVAHWQQTSNGSVIVVGHSLGGGLALIVGAQRNVSAIGMSGVNTLLSRHTFTPPVTEEALDKFTFNVIPERDPIPRIDDVALLSGNIKCRAPRNELIACHTMLRTLCEVIHICGSGDRPSLCSCGRDFGYPPPINTTEVTYEEVCSP